MQQLPVKLMEKYSEFMELHEQ